MASILARDIDPASDPHIQPFPGTPVGGYVLAWSDEFNANSLNTNKWNYRTGVRYWSVQQPPNNAVSNGLYRGFIVPIPIQMDTVQGSGQP